MTCKQCGQAFEKTNGRQETCSVGCRKAWRKKRNQEWHRENKDRHADRKAKEYRLDPSKHRERKSKYRAQNPEKSRLAVRKAWGVINPTGETKNGKCECCDYVGPLFFDHCHRSGIFRGWLCPGCNWALGHAKDDPIRLEALAAYIRRSQGAGGAQGVSPENEPSGEDGRG